MTYSKGKKNSFDGEYESEDYWMEFKKKRKDCLELRKDNITYGNKDDDRWTKGIQNNVKNIIFYKILYT